MRIRALAIGSVVAIATAITPMSISAIGDETTTTEESTTTEAPTDPPTTAPSTTAVVVDEAEPDPAPPEESTSTDPSSTNTTTDPSTDAPPTGTSPNQSTPENSGNSGNSENSTTTDEESTNEESEGEQSEGDDSGDTESDEREASPTTMHEGRSVLAVQQLVVTPLVAGDVIGSNHPDCPGIVKDLAPGATTPVAGEVWIKAGNEHESVGTQAAGYVIPTTFNGKEVSHADVCPTTPPTTTTTTQPGSTTTTTSSTTTTQPGSTTTSTSSTTTTSTSTTTTQPGSTTTSSSSSSIPTGQFSIDAEPLCPDGTEPTIAITFGVRPDLHGQIGTLTFSTGGSIELEFRSGETVPIQYPDSAGTGPVTLTYTLGTESVTREVTFPEACAPGTTTTTTQPGGSTTTTTEGGSTTSSSSSVPPTPGLFSIGGVSPICVADVPVVSITFGSRTDLNDSTILIEFLIQNPDGSSGEVVGTAELVYQAGETVQLVYPGATIDPVTGEATDWPGWMLNEDGFWVTDPSDAAFRDGLNIVATALLTDETATAAVEYPPETELCANPPGPFPPGVTTTTAPGTPPAPGAPPAPGGALPPTR